MRTRPYIVLIFLLFLSQLIHAQKSDSLRTVYYFKQFQENEYVNTQLAGNYADSGLYYAKRTKDDVLLGLANQFLGWYNQDNAQFRKANDFFYKSLVYFKKAGYDQGIADAYGNLGNSFLDIHEFRKSLDYQLLSLEMNEAILKKKKLPKADRAKAEMGKTYALHNIGAIYSEIEMFDKALEYEFRSLPFELKSGNWEGVAISYNTLATIHKELNNLDSAKYYYKLSLDLYQSEKVDFPFGYASALQSYAALPNSGLTKKARDEMWLKSLALRRDFGDVDGEARTLLDIAEKEFDRVGKDSLSAILKHVYSIITTHELDMLMERYLKLYARYNSKIGSYDSAYFALENYLELKELSEEKNRTHDLIAGDIKHQLRSKHLNDSLQIEHKFALERVSYHEELSQVQNVVYLSIIGLIILIVSLMFFVSSNRRKKRLNELLSEKNMLINRQKEEVELKNRSISDSINYAKRLQEAILPTKEQVNRFLPDSFLLYLPKDIVSGDFHWFEHKGDLLFLAVADCTGHGVPGAMVSVVCSNALNRSVNEFNLREPHEILNKTRELVIETLGRSGGNVADGMDIALISIDKRERKLRFSGANNGLWLIRSGTHPDLEEFKGDRQPIGMHAEMHEFISIEIAYTAGDMIYLFSDGFADQFGGPLGKKYKYQRLKDFLVQHARMETKIQGELLLHEFTSWKGAFEQVDDVCIIGVRL